MNLNNYQQTFLAQNRLHQVYGCSVSLTRVHVQQDRVPPRGAVLSLLVCFHLDAFSGR